MLNNQEARILIPAVTRPDIEDFLYHEAALLDDWRLAEWLELLTEDAEYIIPAAGLLRSADATTALALVRDDRSRLAARVKQYLDGTVAAESPPSRLRRMVSNVRIVGSDANAVHVSANIVVYRFRSERMDTFVGTLEHVLLRTGATLKIRRRRVTLDLESLHLPGMLSIIL